MAANGHTSNAEYDNDSYKLMSLENLEDRASPELWPEQMPGVNEFAAMGGLSNSYPGSSASNKPKWMNELETEDISMVQELGNLTPAQLLDKVRQLQNLAYQLGLDEAHEMTRGKFLNILQRPKQGLGS